MIEKNRKEFLDESVNYFRNIGVPENAIDHFLQLSPFETQKFIRKQDYHKLLLLGWRALKKGISLEIRRETYTLPVAKPTINFLCHGRNSSF